MDAITQERLETAVNNIMSGGNACGTLANAALSGDSGYFRGMIRPVVEAYEEEKAHLIRERDYLSKSDEVRRFALESVLSNMDIPAGPVMDAIARTMPGHPLLKG